MHASALKVALEWSPLGVRINYSPFQQRLKNRESMMSGEK
jgi:hypothetical protein